MPPSTEHDEQDSYSLQLCCSLIDQTVHSGHIVKVAAIQQPKKENE